MFESIQKKVISKEFLKELELNSHYDHKNVVFCTGCFDILQSGHAVFFNQCKEFGDILVVGVGRDSTIKRLKGDSRPVNPEQNRAHLVASLQDVDYVILNDENPNDDKIDFEEIISILKPKYFVLNSDDSSINSKFKICSKYGVDIKLVDRVVPDVLKSTSTTDIFNKINYKLKSPLRIDFAGGWTDVPYIMGDNTGYVTNVAIKPVIEVKNNEFNFSGYPRGSGLSTSTAVKLLELIDSKNYNSDSKSVKDIAEDLFNLENKELNWAIGKQDQYAIVHGGINTFKFEKDNVDSIYEFNNYSVNKLINNILLLHTGISRNSQQITKEVYKNYKTKTGKKALKELSKLGQEFGESLMFDDLNRCAKIIDENFKWQKELAPSTSNKKIEKIYKFAKKNGAVSGKLCGAGGGGAFIFYSENKNELLKALKKKFSNVFEIDFTIETENVKSLNNI